MTQGFFSKKETTSNSRPNGKIYSCASCGLFKHCNSPKMQAHGEFKKNILCIGEAPTEIDDRKGKPWQGKTGKLLQYTLDEFGIDLQEDCLSINAVNCKPEDNRYPTNDEINSCRKFIFKLIDEYQPKLILLFGGSALFSFLGHRWKKDLGLISKWRGYIIPDRDYKCWVAPLFHPLYVERGEKEIETIWRQDLKKALEKTDTPLPKYKKPEIEIIEDLSVLDNIKTSVIAFDYETTGKKPHAKGHRIKSVSIATSANHAYAFMMPTSKKKREPLIRLLTNPHIGKIAQNIKYEDIWTKEKLYCEVSFWEWDTMQAAHVLDNRTGVTGLKFQVYVKLGIIDYDSDVSPYLKAKDYKNANAINRIDKLLALPDGKQKLLLYNGYDAIYEYRIAWMQVEEIGYEFLPF